MSISPFHGIHNNKGRGEMLGCQNQVRYRMDCSQLKCLHEQFIEQAKKTPNEVALVSHDGKEMTFAEVDRATSVLAKVLKKVGCRAGSIVGIYMERCLEFCLAYIAAMRAGGAYLPIEFAYPIPLLQSVLDDAQPVAVLTMLEYQKWLPSGINVINLDEGWVEKLEKEIEGVEELPTGESKLEDLAYVVYSSGTTGKPKGIMCPHKGAAFSYQWRHVNYPFEEGERVACNVFFVWEFLRSLLKGVPMYIIPDNVIYDPPLLLKFLKENRISRVLFTPSLLEAVLDAPDLDIAAHFESMKIVWLCGEVVTMALRDRFLQLMPRVKLLNLYSISECHDVAVADLSYGMLEKQMEMTGERSRKFCPVGKIFEGVHVVILDENKKVMPIGMPGEIYVGGPTLALGYLKRPDLTAERFVARPDSVSEKVGEKLYRTGDWGYVLSSGELEICGRCDSMVKIRGYSIELQAVEAALLDLPLVNACIVLAHGEEGTDKYLVAYVVPADGATKRDIRAALKTRLPFHMIPSYFVLLHSVPVAQSGKLDKRTLPKFEKGKEEGLVEEGAPSTPTEHTLAEIWMKILQLKSVDSQENFFDLGGHSLLAARMLAEVRDLFSIEIKMVEFFKYNTIVSLAALIDTKTGNERIDEASRPEPLNLIKEVEVHDQTFVNMDMMLRAFWRSCQYEHRWEYGRVLLTGATGYLGAFLLRDLLEITKVHVYCLIREIPEQKIQSRLLSNLQRYGLIAKDEEQPTEEQASLRRQFLNRVTAVKGDVSLINFGLSPDDYAYFAYEIDFVIHAAAVVNLIYPYEVLHGPNVLGTENVLLFACTSKIKPVHHISTDAVFPHGLQLCGEDDDMTEYYDKLKDGYSQSKWVAEQIVLKAGEKGLPVAVYRLGNLSGECKSGFWNPADFNLLMLLGSLYTESAPNIDWKIEMTPVDFVSKSIVKLTQTISWSLGKVFHIINDTPMDSKYFLEWISTHGYPLTIVPFDDWITRVRKVAVARNHKTLKLLVQLLESMVKDASFFGHLSTYRNDNFKRVLQVFEMAYPLVDGNLLSTYLTSLAARRVIPEPKVVKQAKRPLSGKVAVVTGASSGIGAAVAQKLAESGAAVAVAARRLDRLEEVRNRIVQNGDIAIALRTDVVDRKQVEDLVVKTEATLGPIDFMIPCAGTMYYTLMKNVHVAEWEKQVDINCKGVLNCVSAVLPYMLKRGQGHFVFMSSDAGRKVFPGLTVYSASKFFVEGIAQGLRLETASTGIKVTSIQPGDVKTELIQHTTDSEAKKQYAATEDAEVLIPEDVANAVLYAINQPKHCSINEILVEPREYPI